MTNQIDKNRTERNLTQCFILEHQLKLKIITTSLGQLANKQSYRNYHCMEFLYKTGRFQLEMSSGSISDIQARPGMEQLLTQPA